MVSSVIFMQTVLENQALLQCLLYKLFENWDMTDNSGLLFIISKSLVILVYFSFSLFYTLMYLKVQKFLFQLLILPICDIEIIIYFAAEAIVLIKLSD